MLASSSARAGRSHRDRNVPCQDAYAVHAARDRTRVAAAVADGLGSRPLSHHGSSVAAQAAARSLAETTGWGPAAMHRAFRAARTALQRRAHELSVPMDALATTLQVAVVSRDAIIAGSVGDGAIVYSDPSPRILLPPAEAEYANAVTPLTHADWSDHLRIASGPAPHGVFLFTDGLTRLLLERRGHSWKPHEPFFEAFLPRIEPARFDERLVGRFLASDTVDQAWDDDKCMVVVRVE